MALPEKIGRYEIERELGAGGMGEVYLARDPFINRQVAIKVLPRPRAQEAQQFRARFEREAQIIAKLEHPGIVPIHDFGYHEDQPYIVMRYMAGGTLKDRMKGEPLPSSEIIRIFRQLTHALEYIHSQGIIHRDLKPMNILFDLAGNAYISDFGIAKLSEATTDLTGGATIGTPAYMSPEQARGIDELDPRSDVYSIGIVLFEMLTGKIPYQGKTPVSQAMAHITEPIPDITKLRPNLPQAYRKLLNKALEKDREQRFGTMSDLLHALEKTEQEEQIELSVSHEVQRQETLITDRFVPKPQPTQEQKIPRWVWIGGGGCGIMLLVLLLGIFAVSKFLLPAFAPTTPSLTSTQTLTVAPTETIFIEIISSPTSTISPMPSSTPTPTVTPFPSQIIDDFGVPMVLVPAGEFQMGSENGDDDELPIHSVFLDDFYMDQYEVTNERYALCVDSGACNPPSNTTSNTRSSYYGIAEYANYPVIYVSWNDANAYCSWRGASLPTEAQWEKASRGGLEGVNFPWGNEFDGTLANFCDSNCSLDSADSNFDDGYPETSPVGSFAPNGYGLYDMVGNVWEWVADWYGGDYYAVSPATNPTGPETGERRILRGGSWSAMEVNMRSANRNENDPTLINFNLGIRCARSP